VAAVELLIELQAAVGEHADNYLALTRRDQGQHDDMLILAKMACGWLEDLALGRPTIDELVSVAEAHALAPAHSALERADALAIAALARNAARHSVAMQRLRLVA
jgi:hypothetical protein